MYFVQLISQRERKEKLTANNINDHKSVVKYLEMKKTKGVSILFNKYLFNKNLYLNFC